MNQIKLSRLNELVYRVLTDSGDHVGNLKRIAGAWKFKAIGYDTAGDTIPGGGPLTHQHNMIFTDLDEANISARLNMP
jgi:hypothetical protein